jgi:dienelactone hydrolase
VTTIQLKGLDPINLKDRVIDFEFYQPLHERKDLGSVIIVPPIYGDTPLDRWSARRFCKSGLQTALIRQWEFYADPGLDWESHDRGTLRAVTAIRHVLEVLVSRKPGPIGVLGTSLGAITASLALSIEPRLTTGVLIVGGAPVSEVLANSRITDAVKLKKYRMNLDHLSSDEEYQHRLSDFIHFDPVAYAEKAEPKNIWMFVAKADKIVPTANQWKLWEAWNNPKLTQARLGHIGMMIYSYTFWDCAIRDFFVEKLAN